MVCCMRKIWSMADSIQDLEYCGGAEQKKPGNMLFTFEQVNAASGTVDPIYLLEAYLFRDLDNDDQDSMEIEVPKRFSFTFSKEDGKYSEMEFAGMAKPNIADATTILTKCRKF